MIDLDKRKLFLAVMLYSCHVGNFDLSQTFWQTALRVITNKVQIQTLALERNLPYPLDTECNFSFTVSMVFYRKKQESPQANICKSDYVGFTTLILKVVLAMYASSICLAT